jgi:hypothetical protein
VAEKLVLAKKGYLEYYRLGLARMRRGQVAWLKIGPLQHKGVYHKQNSSK